MVKLAGDEEMRIILDLVDTIPAGPSFYCRRDMRSVSHTIWMGHLFWQIAIDNSYAGRFKYDYAAGEFVVE